MYKQTVLHYIQEYAQTQPDTLAVCELRKTVTYAVVEIYVDVTDSFKMVSALTEEAYYK